MAVSPLMLHKSTVDASNREYKTHTYVIVYADKIPYVLHTLQSVFDSNSPFFRCLQLVFFSDLYRIYTIDARIVGSSELMTCFFVVLTTKYLCMERNVAIFTRNNTIQHFWKCLHPIDTTYLNAYFLYR